MKSKTAHILFAIFATFASACFAGDRKSIGSGEVPLSSDGSETTPLENDKVPASPVPAPTPLPGLADRMRNTSDAFWLNDYPLNELFQYLASQAGYQYFYSPALNAIAVTGQLYKAGTPVEQMEELALQYNLVLYHRGRTIYALTLDQLSTLPQQELRYELKYLRFDPDPQKAQNDVHRMLDQFITPQRGSVTFEPKVNTIVVVDNETVLRKVAAHLAKIDRPKRQISIQVRVLSIANTAQKGTGVDWSKTLGSDGLALSATAQGSLNSLFGFDPWASWNNITKRGNSSAPTTLAPASGTSVTVGPVTVTAILRALYGNDRVNVENAPLVVTEDNEPADIGVVTRTPIVTSTVSTSNGVTNIANEVRYQIDTKDPTGPPQDRREIGTQLAVTPTILPDGTIRLQIDGTVATQTGTVAVTASAGITNSYPIVNESRLNNVARIPSGYSLILGGFMNDSESESKTKVPFLGDIPLLGNAFRSKNMQKIRSTLVFIITPVAYDADSASQSVGVSEKTRQNYSIQPNDNYADPEELGKNADLLCNTKRTDEPDTNPLSDRSQENIYARPARTRQERKQQEIVTRYRQEIPVRRALPVDADP
ncbi:MAG TPA: hypothetical protein VK673_02450 [Chthoniobacterales bacterium]|nr:hypothetical protein [Chthoniobacterales bacterium]